MDHGTAKVFAFAVGGKVHNAQVHAERPAVRFWQVLGCLTALGDVQVVDARTPDQISSANLPRRVYQHLVLTRSQHQTADDTPLQGIEGDAIQAHQPVGARVVAHTAAWA